jgi:group I intron endonuclease
LTNKRPNSYIHRAILAHGYLNFTLKILEYCDRGNTFTREQYYLDLLKPEYNIQKLAAYSGYKHPDEVRKQMSEWEKRIHFMENLSSEEVKALICS